MDNPHVTASGRTSLLVFVLRSRLSRVDIDNPMSMADSALFGGFITLLHIFV